MTDLVRFLTDFVSGILLIPALVALAFLTLYLPSLIITRGLYFFRRKQGPAMRFLSRPIGPSIPGRGADRSALRHALTLWAMLGLKTVSCTTTLLVIGSGYALFGVAVEGWVEIAFYTVMFTAFFAAVVSGVECVLLLVRLALHAPRNPASSQLIPGNLEPPDGGRAPSDTQSRGQVIADSPEQPTQLFDFLFAGAHFRACDGLRLTRALNVLLVDDAQFLRDHMTLLETAHDN